MKEKDGGLSGHNEEGQVINVKAKEIIIVSLILAVWFYSLYR